MHFTLLFKFCIVLDEFKLACLLFLSLCIEIAAMTLDRGSSIKDIHTNFTPPVCFLFTSPSPCPCEHKSLVLTCKTFIYCKNEYTFAAKHPSPTIDLKCHVLKTPFFCTPAHFHVTSTKQRLGKTRSFRNCKLSMGFITYTTLFLAFSIISVLECGKPSLSDPLGLFEQPEFVGTGKNYVSGSVWPKPQSETRQSTYFALDPSRFAFSSVGQQSSVLSLAMDRYKILTFPDTKVLTEPKLGLIETLQIKVINKYEPFTLASDESCKYLCFICYFDASQWLSSLHVKCIPDKKSSIGLAIGFESFVHQRRCRKSCLINKETDYNLELLS